MNKAINIKDIKLVEIKEISVREWHPLPDGKGKPEHVHLWIKIKSLDAILVLRFKTGQPLDELIVALITHRKSVFG